MKATRRVPHALAGRSLRFSPTRVEVDFAAWLRDNSERI